MRKLFKTGMVEGMMIAVTIDTDRVFDLVCRAARNKTRRATLGGLTAELRRYPELNGVPPSPDLQRKIRNLIES